MRPRAVPEIARGSRGSRRRERLRRAVGAVGRVLAGAGVVLLLFVAYQLWGTGLREEADQRALRSAFESHLTPEYGSPTAASSAPLPPEEPLPPPSAGEPVAIMRIPKLGLDKVVVEGTDLASLQKGPGHQPGTAALGGPGNAVVGGHRTTYGAPFYRLDELRPGDTIAVEVADGEARYTVTGSQVVDPSAVWILDPTPDNRLTLFTCTPRFSAARRLVVTARLDGTPLAPPSTTKAAPASVLARPTPPPAPATLAAADGSLAAAVAWGLATVLTAAAIWWGGRRYRRLVVYALGAPLLALVLFGAFERVASLLPSAV